MTRRLSNATLDQLPPSVRRPTYDRETLVPSVVHIGLGAFHRAHQAPVFQALANAGDMRWGVVGTSLRSSAVQKALAPQDFLYTLAVEDGDAPNVTLMNIIRDVIVAPEEPARLIEAIAARETQIITVTVTEKGYQANSACRIPQTMPDYLVAGLQTRRECGLPPITIISCDNIVGNGGKLRTIVTESARSYDASLGDWIESECAFPATMVDRIVPATRKTDIDAIAKRLGMVDQATVRTEPFWQWVIEDRFVRDRPDFESVGVQMASNVESWEQAKLRLLNGAHSAMAYLGLLAGISTVDRFVAEHWGRAVIGLLWDQVHPTIAPEIDVAAYRDSLLNRFRNEAIGHRLQQIAMDGSQKLPQRLVDPAVELLESGRSPSAIALILAAWMRFHLGRSDSGAQLEIDDPLASTIERSALSVTSSEDLARAMLGLESIFPARLGSDARFVTMVADHLEDLRSLGARRTVEQFVGVCI